MTPAARIRRLLVPPLVLVSLIAVIPTVALAMPPTAPLPWEAATPQRAVPGEVVVTFDPGTSRAEAAVVHRQVGALDVDRAGRTRQSPYVVRVGVGNVDRAIGRYLAHPLVRSAEPNRIATPTFIPSDERFPHQWSMHNTGQTHKITDVGLSGKSSSGTPDADIDAAEAWDVTTGQAGVVVAVLDTGVDIDNPELAPSMWVNTLEDAGTPGVDDDNNGYIDDVHGYDFKAGDPNPSPPANNPHGTHVAGVIGAAHDGDGIAGVCPGCEIMGLRFDFSVGQEIEAIEYAVANGADIINMSFGGSAWSQAERDAIEAAGDAGVLTVVSAGNASLDNDISFYPQNSNDFAPAFPASYALPTILTVAASDDHDRYAAFTQCSMSNIPRWRCAFTSWGRESVDVAAPGVDILSTVVTGGVFPGLDVWDGTSMAAPHVSGIAGLVLSHNPGYSPLDIKNAIMNSVDEPSSLDMWTSWANVIGVRKGGLSGTFTQTQGRVNAFAALTGSTADATLVTDGTIGNATPIGNNASGGVNWPKDTNDVFAVDLDKGTRYNIFLDGPLSHDLDLWVWSPNATEIWQFTPGCFRRNGSCPALRAVSASPSGREAVSFKAGTAGTYYIQVNAWYDKASYTIRVRS